MAKRARDAEHGVTPGRRVAILGALVALVFGFFATVLVGTMVHSTARADAEKQFADSASQREKSIETQVQSYYDKLHDIGGFVANSPGASNTRFTNYVHDTLIFDQIPSVVGVFFVYRVVEADLPAFLDRAHTENPTLGILPIGPHEPGTPHYILTYYIPGTVDLHLPLGTDIGPLSSVTDLIEKSRSNSLSTPPAPGGIAGTFQDDPLLRRIANEQKSVPLQPILDLDFFIGIPVSEPSAAGAARKPPVGWVGATIDNFAQFVTAPAKDQTDDLGVAVKVDLTTTGINADNVNALSREAQRDGNAGTRTSSAFERTYRFNVEGVDWQVVVWSSPAANDVSFVSRIVALAGFLASFLLAGVVYLRVRARQRDQAFSSELADRELFQRDMLASVTNAMVVLDAHGNIIGSNPAWTSLRTVFAPDPGAHPERRASDTEPATAGFAPASDPHSVDGSADSDVGFNYLSVLAHNLRSSIEELEVGLAQVLHNEVDAIEVDVPIADQSRRRWYAVRATPLRGKRGGAVVVHTDITERKRTHDELELKATHDGLTGLLNRAAFEDEVSTAMNHARATEAHVAVLFLDLDGFKPINDTFGHAAGDAVLRAVAQRVSGSVRTTDRVARLGGDEFVVLISPLIDPQIAQTTATRILRSLDAPVAVGANAISISASIGIAILEAPLGGSHETLMELADEAMYLSKQRGGGQFTLSE